MRAAVSPTGDRLFVTARNSNAVLVFDSSRLLSDGPHARTALVPVGQSPTPIAVIDHGTTLLVGNTGRYSRQPVSGTLTVLNTAELQQGADAVLGVIHTGSFPRAMRVSPDGNTVFLTNWASDFLQVIDLKELPKLLSH